MSGANTTFDWVQFAEIRLLRPQLDRFERDIRICLRKDEKTGKHAYFPGLTTCISFLEFMSGLYAGNVESRHGYIQLCDYADRFMDRTVYTNLHLSILYEGFRHKLAHLAHPYFVFDTATKKSKVPEPKRRIVWTVRAKGSRPPITLVPHTDEIRRYKLPWSVPYDHRIHISVAGFKRDIVSSVRGRNGYLAALKKDPALQRKFAKCMEQFFPPQ